MFTSLFQHVHSVTTKLVVVSVGTTFVQTLSLRTSHCLVSQQSQTHLTVLVAKNMGYAAVVHHVAQMIYVATFGCDDTHDHSQLSPCRIVVMCASVPFDLHQGH